MSYLVSLFKYRRFQTCVTLTTIVIAVGCLATLINRQQRAEEILNRLMAANPRLRIIHQDFVPITQKPVTSSVLDLFTNISSETPPKKVASTPVPTAAPKSNTLGLPVEAVPPEKQILIPHIIHQTWDNEKVPSYFKKWIQSWTQKHPDWEYWFWTPKEVRRLIEIVNPEFLTEYNEYPKEVFRANSMRYYIMYYFGGVYADLDLEVLKPLDSWTYSQYCVLPENTYAHPFLLEGRHRSTVMITMLACRPKHPYFKYTIDNLSIYPKMNYSQKLHYADLMYLKYNATSTPHLRPEDDLYLAHSNYFLPTFDPGWNSKFRSMCTSSYHRSRLHKGQLEVCDELRKDNFKNKPRPESYTTHYWVHVIAKTDAWKQTDTVNIRDVVPKMKDINKVLDDLENELKRKSSQNAR